MMSSGMEGGGVRVACSEGGMGSYLARWGSQCRKKTWSESMARAWGRVVEAGRRVVWVILAVVLRTGWWGGW